MCRKIGGDACRRAPPGVGPLFGGATGGAKHPCGGAVRGPAPLGFFGRCFECGRKGKERSARLIWVTVNRYAMSPGLGFRVVIMPWARVWVLG